MEQCVARLDIAMFNAILRESAHEIPTDPISDPIVDSKVLPIPAGDLSFGFGAQLKNYVCIMFRFTFMWFAHSLSNHCLKEIDCLIRWRASPFTCKEIFNLLERKQHKLV